MDRRTNASIVGTNVSDSIISARADIPSVAKAAALTIPELEAKLTGASDFTFRELVRVGGLLHVPAHSLMEGAR